MFQSIKYALIPVFFLLCGVAHAYSAARPISTCTELQDEIPFFMAGDFYLTNDIDCTRVFRPIDGVFAGTLDGRGYTISNLTIKNSGVNNHRNAGLFRKLGPSEDGLHTPVIKNINFVNAGVYANPDVHRGLIAAIADQAEISNITVNGLEVWEVGGYIDHLGASGGIVGHGIDTKLINVHIQNVAIQKNAFAGGLIGMASGATSIEKSSVSGLSSGGAHCNKHTPCAFGGLIGRAGGDTGKDKTVRISESSAEGYIDTRQNTGGLIGIIKPWQMVFISNSYAEVKLIPDCFQGCNFAGGLIGQAELDTGNKMVILDHVYAAARVRVSSNDKGRAIVGHAQPDGANQGERVGGFQSYYDLQVTDKKNSGDNFSVGLKTQAMQDPSEVSFATWDRTIWKFEPGQYPRLYYNQTPAQ